MADYRAIYFRNIYEVELLSGSIFSFSLIDFKNSDFYDRPFAIISAFNPQNRSLEAQQNRARDRQLYNELNSNRTILKARGCLDGHCEDGYLVYDITEVEAIAIALQYDQYAIFYNSTEALQYIKCENGEVIVSKRR